MAVRGYGYFDGKGQFFKQPCDATISDLAAMLGKVGEGDSLAMGIAKILLDRRREIEHIFADHDAMFNGDALSSPVPQKPVLVAQSNGDSTDLRKRVA